MKKLFIFFITLLFIGITQAQIKLKSVKIGKQTWMDKNLNVATYRNGDPIPKVTNDSAWAALTTGAYCYYKNDSATYDAIYGKLYNWYAVNDPRGLAPAGWHVPSNAEWITMATSLGGRKVAGGPMKETGTTHWQTPNTGATNIRGFTGLPGGYRIGNASSYNQGYFNDIGQYAYWWTSTISGNKLFADYCSLHYSFVSMSTNRFEKICGLSVRCLRN